MAEKLSKLSRQETENMLRITDGINCLKQNLLFRYFLDDYRIRVYQTEKLGKHEYVQVEMGGDICVNRKERLEPEQWAHMIAHASLHLAFGHFLLRKVSGVWKVGARENCQQSFNYQLWNLACDIYVENFLDTLKVGKALSPPDFSLFPRTVLSDESEIYRFLAGMEQKPDIRQFGTAGGSMDMADLQQHIEIMLRRRDWVKGTSFGNAVNYAAVPGQSSATTGTNPVNLSGPANPSRGWHWANSFTEQFTYALAQSVTAAVSTAGGHDPETGKKYTRAQKAANWFITHYPLLGGIASGFRIIEDYKFCRDEDITVAAVCPEKGEIYINPAAGLNDEELVFVMAHEFLHAGLMHGERCQGRDPYLWNVACDYVINGWLREMRIGTLPQQCLYDQDLKNVSAEELYDRMAADMRKYRKLETLHGYGKGDIIRGSGYRKLSDGISLDDFYRNALSEGLEFHLGGGRGLLPAGLVEEIRALAMPPIPWDVELARWFDGHFEPVEKHRSYARPSRRQGSTPDIPRPSYVRQETAVDQRTFGVIVDTSGSMERSLLGKALGAIASYAVAKDVPAVRVVFCDAEAYDCGYMTPEDIAGRVRVKGRGGTVLQPGVDVLEKAKDFPKKGPILIITDGWIERNLKVRREHAYLVPKGHRLPFHPQGKVFYMD